MSAQFTIPLQTVIPGQLIASALWNAEFQNIGTNFIPAGMDSYSDTDSQMQIQTNPFPGSVTSHATSLGGELERIRYQIAQMLGNTYWYQPTAINLNLAAQVVVPIGGCIDWPTPQPPNGNWVKCNGQAISRVGYPDLFTLMGTTFGAGDGSTTFNVPDYTDRMMVGAGNLYPLGSKGGSPTHTLTKLEIPTGLHTFTDPGHVHSISDPGHAHGVTDPPHSHPEQVKVGGSGASGTALRLSTDLFGSTVDAAGIQTGVNTSGVTVNSGSTGITNANANSTGISLTDNAGGASHSVLNPYTAMYKMMRAT